MRFVRFAHHGHGGLAVAQSFGAPFHGLMVSDSEFPTGGIDKAIACGAEAIAALHRKLSRGPVIDIDAVDFLTPLTKPGKIICIGLNYSDHAAESGLKPPEYPTVFARFA